MRKQVTVLFADLKGSMELLADRDPEEARKLLDRVLEHMMEAVHRYEGTVNQVMGDGIMALFGALLAHEDHAVRACYAALRMQESIKRCSEGVRRGEGVPIPIGPMSPLTTAPNQTLASCSTVTWPISQTPGAMKAAGAIRGRCWPYGRTVVGVRTRARLTSAFAFPAWRGSP